MVRRYTLACMNRKLGQEPTVILNVRIPGEWMRALAELADAKNPVRELVRDALKRFLKANHKLEEE